MSLKEDLKGVTYPSEVVMRLSDFLPLDVFEEITTQILEYDSLMRSIADAETEAKKELIKVKARKIHDAWLAEKNIHARALTAFGSTRQVPDLFYSILFELPSQVILASDKLEILSIAYGDKLVDDFRNPEISNRVLTYNFIHELFDNSEDWVYTSLPRALAEGFIKDKSNTVSDRARIACEADLLYAYRNENPFFFLKKTLLQEARDELGLGDVPDSWVEEIVTLKESA